MAGRLNKKVLGGVVCVVLATGAGVTWLQRVPLLSWFYVHRLAAADEGGAAAWAERCAGLGEAAVPDLLDCLADANPAACRNARVALARLTGRWGSGDPRTVALALRLGREFGRYSAAGQQSVLELASNWYPAAPGAAPPAPGLLPACARLLSEAVAVRDAETQDRALALCGVLLAQEGGAEALGAGRALVRMCLASASAANRLRAIRLALHPGMDLLEQVAALLGDSDAEVRRGAVVAVGPKNNVVLEDALLPCLHDPDPEVRRLAEVALQSRDLKPEQIRLGFLLTDADPLVRIQVFDQLRKMPDLEPTVLLDRLSHDPSPAIRAAAIRVLSQLRMTERIDEMARTDSLESVRFIARCHLERAENR